MSTAIQPLPELSHDSFRNVAEKLAFDEQVRGLQRFVGHKSAADVSDDEGKFEQAFANIAMTQVKNKSPQLLENLLGFQLVDRNEDKTKAVGILGFDVGGKLMYVPVFFLAGKVKGLELLFLKDQNQFVPCEEDWVNYLLGRRPHILGEGSDKTPRELGASTPTYASLSWVPSGTKFASTVASMPAWAQAFLPTMARCTITDDSVWQKFASTNELVMALWPESDLEGLLSSSYGAVAAAVRETQRRPAVKAAFDKMYGPDFLGNCLMKLRTKLAAMLPKTDVLKSAEAPVQLDFLGQPIVAKTPDIEIRYKTADVYTDDLTDEQQSALLRDGVVVLDHRKSAEQVANVYYTTQGPLTLQNPDDTGIYQVLTKGNKFERCLVVANPIGGDGRAPGVLVYPLGGDKKWVLTSANNVFVKDKESNEDFQKWLSSQSTDTALATDSVYMLMNKDGSGSVPFEVYDKVDDGTYRVSFRDHVERSRVHPSRGYDACCSASCDDLPPHVYIRNQNGNRFKAFQGSLHASKDCYRIKLKANRDSEGNYIDSPSPIQPGGVDDLYFEIMAKTAALKVWSDHGSFYINRDNPVSPTDAVVKLVCQYGVTEKVAHQILKEAQRPEGARYRLKEASSPFLTQSNIQVPDMPSVGYGYDPRNGAALQESEEYHLPVRGMQFAEPGDYGMSQFGDPEPRGMRQAVSAAAQTGQKKVFDTSAMTSMIRAIGDDQLVDSHLGDLMRALNRLGQLLFTFYWHQDDFADRYGKQDLPELEDAIRNSFQTLGAVILYLRKKSIRPSAEDELGEPQIDEAAGN